MTTDIISKIESQLESGQSIFRGSTMDAVIKVVHELRALRNSLETSLQRMEDGYVERGREIEALKARGDAAESALVSMVRQYLWHEPAKDEDPAWYSHDFMSAGEEALEYLENRKIVECGPFEKYVFVVDKKSEATK